jgi:CRP-like cAMP-binding protein
MYVDCSECRLRRRAMFRQMSDDELAFVAQLKSDQIDMPAHAQIVEAGGNGHRLYTLLSGWAFSYKQLPHARRQILDFLLPGDLIGLQSPTTGRVDHSVCAITSVTLCVLDGQPFETVFAKYPALAASLLTTSVNDQMSADIHRLLLGREHPTQRLAYLLLELRHRLAERGLLDGDVCGFPLTYAMLSDATGMSRSQLAHSLAELREFDWAITQPGQLRFGDVAAMARGCGYSERAMAIPRAML